ncbi:hypothetical protein EON80_11505 [bacterium]|nr:MAG: hypothetical protein EON80_11505 [bacterium]
MLRPENTHPGDGDVQLRDSDNLETTLAAGQDASEDSASTQSDAGLLEVPENLDTDFEADDSLAEEREITMTDLQAGEDGPRLHSPEMSDYDAPGEIDIEELDENALSDTDIPRDALLDPLEP